MLDRTIPFYNLIMKCEGYGYIHSSIPDGYQIVSYRPGFETDWARLECLAGDFETEQEARDYFCQKYLSAGSADDILFLLNHAGSVIGSCIAWKNDRNGIPVNSLHWLIVDEAYQGKKLGRFLCETTINRFCEKGAEPIYIHTQPWSWNAILLYSSLGFHLQKSDSFGNYSNQYDLAMETLRQILPANQIRILIQNSDD